MVAARPAQSMQPQPPPGCFTRGGCKARTRLACRPVARVGSVIRSSPAVLVVPFMMFSFCVIGGVIAVRYAATSFANAERTKALSLVNTATTVRARPHARPHTAHGSRAALRGTRRTARIAVA